MKQKFYVLAVVLITSLLACSQLFAASSGKCGENLTWTLDDEGNLVIEGTGNMTDYSSISSIPWGLDIKTVLISDGVTSIGKLAFRGCKSLISANISNSVTIICDYAFYGCSSLKSIDIPNSVISIGSRSFYMCTNLSNLTLGASVISIEELAFYHCEGVTSLKIPDSVTNINDYAFAHCKALKNVEIGKSVTNIGKYAFNECRALSYLEFDMLGKSNQEITFGEHVFAGCANLKKVNIHDISAWCNISFADYSANPIFWTKNLFLNGNEVKNIVIPDGVTAIRNYAFWQCHGLENIILPNTVKSIGGEAFYDCYDLSLIELPNSVVEIDEYAFDKVPYPIIKVNAVNPPVLKGKLPMTTAIVPNASVAAYKSAEYWKDMTILSQEKTEVEITMTDGVGLAEAIVKQAKITPASVTAIKVHGSLTSDDIKTTLGINMLNCYSIDISDTDVEELPVDAFEGRTALFKIILPRNLKIIGDNAFSGCSFLKYCDLETLSVVKIGDYAFWGCCSLSDLKLPFKLANIGYCAFCRSNIEEVDFPETVKTIVDATFSNCTSLKNADMSKLAINKIPDAMFNNCTSLEEVKLPTAIESIGDNAFSGCSKLYNIALPSSVKTVGANAFSGCKSLKVLNLSKSLTTIGNGAFGGCSAVEIINCPAQVPPTISSESTLKDINKNICVLSIPSDKYIEYFSAPYWGQFLEYKSGVCVLVNEDNGCVKYTVNNIEAESTTNAIRTNALTQASVDESNINAEAFNNANICVNENMTITFKIIPNDGYMIGSVKYAGSDVTSQVINGVYTTPLVMGDAEFVVSFKEEFSSVDENEVTDNFKVWSDGMAIYVESGERITVNVTSLIGITRKYVAESGVTEIKVATPGIYIVNGKKVLVR